MKVLTIKEPYATLIKKKVKYIETRSWRTNYRGEIYIHSGLSKVSKDILERKELSKLYSIDELSYGYIICKARLIDCIYMDEDFIESIKKDNYINYISGNYKVGRYAWVLDNIEIINPIKVKGRLGIWNFKE